ncbi:hypothetical protein LTR53_004367 [Teratosphaeriaceae sp. CCFEE 6253]|nr:hypothetical protein LTR53_004367 [Teratosphaeriaceae sp. CCFEE 6253]
MRLLRLNNRGEVQFVEEQPDSVPSYAILSHTWGADKDEVTYGDILDGTGVDKAGYSKLTFCGRQAKQDGLEYFWVDTCCIDKRNLSELAEAINSMFAWYRGAEKCYVYLADVLYLKRDHEGSMPWEEAFRDSKWLTRGWTLQELLAGRDVIFFSREGRLLGSKATLGWQLQQWTGIPASALQGEPMDNFSHEERLRWAEKRQTRKIEDKWYSLLGIFGVHMPLVYGEGENARDRLLDAISKSVRDRLPVDPSSHVPARFTHDRRKALLASLEFEQMDARRSTIKAAWPTTCGWLLNHPTYVAWNDPHQLDQHHGFLWIKGHPGAGKSTLMKSALAQAGKQRHQDEILVSFFFNARGGELEKTIVGMYRSILFEILNSAEDLQQLLDMSQQGQSTVWTVDSLQTLLSTVVSRLSPRRLKCFVDALDECDEDQIREMVDFFEKLASDALKVGHRVLVCFASRHYPTISINEGLQLILEDEAGHDEDMQKYIQKHLRAPKGKRNEEIKRSILEKANGVFMWAVLVIEILNKEIAGGRMFAIKQRLQEIPPKLSDLFKNILRRDNVNMSDLLLCLQWILFARRPLKREEFYFAMVAGLGPKPESMEWIADEVTIDDMSRFVRDSSKGLAELTKSKAPTVQFIHESVPDLLVKDGGLYELWPELTTDVRSRSHDRLKYCCQAGLTIDLACHDSFDKSFPRASSAEGKSLRLSLILKFPFLDYACAGLPYHANEAASMVPQHDFLRTLALRPLLNVANLLEQYEVRRYTQDASLAYVLAENGFARLIRAACLGDSPWNIAGERYKYPLFAALHNGHRDAAQALFRQHESAHMDDRPADVNFGPDFLFDKALTPLLWAVENKLGALAETMVTQAGRACDIDRRGSMGRDALSLAAEEGVTEVVRVLLARRASVHVKDREERTALSRAAQHGHLEIVRLLLDQGAGHGNVATDRSTALHEAASNGHEATVRLLLDRGAETEAKTRYGKTALHLASVAAHEGTVRLLLNHGACVDAIDNQGRTALWLASEGKHESVARLLVERGADVNVHGGRHETPLQAASPTGHVPIVRLLLDNGADIQAEGGDFGSALGAAAAYGKTEVLQLLLDRGAEVNGRARSALWCASCGGREAAVRMLLEHGADIHAQGNGGTALQIRLVHIRSRVSRGLGGDEREDAIVRMLLAAGAVDPWTTNGSPEAGPQDTPAHFTEQPQADAQRGATTFWAVI